MSSYCLSNFLSKNVHVFLCKYWHMCMKCQQSVPTNNCMCMCVCVCVCVCVCGSKGSGLELHPATSSWQDYWHRIPLPLAEIARTQGQSTRIWELPWALLVCKCMCVCVCVCLCTVCACVYFDCVCVCTWVSALYKWSWFPPRCWAPGLRQEHKFIALSFFLFQKYTDTCTTNTIFTYLTITAAAKGESYWQ